MNLVLNTTTTEFRDPARDDRVCELCGNRQFSLMHAWETGDRWNMTRIPIAIWKCQCGAAFLHPVPTADQLPDQGDWWSHRRKRFCRRRRFKDWWRKIRFALIGTSNERMLHATRKILPSGRWIDVGCGEGVLLELAREFYNCTGVEPSSVAAAGARAKGFRVIESRFEEAKIAPRSFDVVTLNSVLEHATSPLSFLRRVNRILRIGGIVVVVTPKLNGPSHFFHGPGWNGFRHGYHTFLFTGKNLRQHLSASGFEVLRRPRRDRILDDILILWARKVAEAGDTHHE
jgi:SAM-dependent methyltransferase